MGSDRSFYSGFDVRLVSRSFYSYFVCFLALLSILIGMSWVVDLIFLLILSCV